MAKAFWIGNLGKPTKKKSPIIQPWPSSPVQGPLSEAEAAGDRIRLIYNRLLSHFGPRKWWPGDTPFEIMVGAILTQNTAWSNAAKAIENLNQSGLLTTEDMDKVSLETLADHIRPSGYYNIKATRLKALVNLIVSNGHGGTNPGILRWPMERLRKALLDVTGVGPETADSIILYAARQPSFVVDAYTRRILARHALAQGEEPYEAIRGWFMRHLPPNTALYNEFHALIVAVGHNLCRPKQPSCPTCPLGDDPWLRPKFGL
jgi:endonuclease-3 related protein